MKDFFQKYFFNTIRGYKKEYLGKDLLAGLMVAALTIPVAMGYAQVAGIPPIYGLYASIVPVIGYAILTGSPDMIVGLDATISAVTGTMLVAFGLTAGSPEAINFAASIALVAGAFLCLFSVFKLGKFTAYVSRTVMDGFISGVALSIVIGQIPKMLSIPAQGTDFFGNLGSIWQNWGQVNWWAAGLAILTAILIIGAKKIKLTRKWPMALIVLVVMTAISFIFKFDQLGIGVVGAIPSGLPKLFLPDFMAFDLSMILGVGLLTAIIVFADSLLSVDSFGLKNKYKVDNNKELAAFGVASILSGFSGTPSVAASVSRTAANNSAGGKTQLTQLFAAGFTLIVVLFLSPGLYYMPQTVLAGIVFAAVLGIVDITPGLTLVKNKDYSELAIWLAAILGVLLVGVLFGVVIAVIMSFADFVRRSVTPPQAFLGKIRGKDGFFDLHRHPNAKPIPGITIYRFSAPLFFANASQFSQSLIQLAEGENPPKVVIMDMSGVSDIDYPAIEEIKAVLKVFEERQVKYAFSAMIGSVRDQFQRLDFSEEMMAKHVFKTTRDAVEAFT